ncbi:hypothetical protein [Polyangium fumosum]|uniref:HEPN domain-containing protein n=1 Tax=Polyangium fumosum TaxID=889272 RepID=A0A4U1J469_9BACT|nr:hypothetical protein [Polyangium fumosum]TKD02009.1 hypothetical protein E8A74_29525 [Polyangium fumosum]
MSNLKFGANGDDYPEAAAKHLTDARTLLDAKRFDGAAYLAGFAIECSLRTVVMVGHMMKLLNEELAEAKRPPVPLARALKPGSRALDFKSVARNEAQTHGRDHDLADLAAATTGYKDVLSEGAVRYVPTVDMTRLPFRDLQKFTNIRYRGNGSVLSEDAAKWLEEACALYDASVGLMRRDGLVK